jgi:hypothetical protein
MIKDTTYEREWIIGIAKKLSKSADPKMLEKVIYAFTLLEQLRTHNIDLIFKGGTCLLLLLDPPRRFSIDIDIITETSAKDLETALDNIVAESPFTKWIGDNDRKHVIDAPVAHYKLYYSSQVDQNQKFGEEPILLDVLFTPNPYPKTKTTAIEHLWLETEGDPVTVTVPVPEAILGHKLTAFAPNTTGILYSKNRHTEIIKQLYDVATLFDVSEDLEVVKLSYTQVVAEEIGFRKLDMDAAGVLDDTFQTCWVLATREKSDALNDLSTGIRNIANFIVGRFKIEEAITASAKTAYLCQLLKQEQSESIERYLKPDQIKDWIIENQEYNKLNKLKKSNPEAFYYWYLALNAMNAATYR